MSGRFKFDVFLSHNAEDKPRVRRLADRLKQAGLRVWFDEWNVGPGDIIALKVDEGLEQSRVLVLCISKNGLASGWMSLERSTAVHRDPANDRRRFIPLLLDDCDLPDTLRRYRLVDFRDEADSAFADLLTACRPEAEDAPPVPERKSKKKSPNKDSQIEPPSAGSSETVEPLAVFERTLTGHGDWVNSVTVSPDNQWMASGSVDKTVKIWGLETGRCQATLEGHALDVNSVAITSDGYRILSSSNDGSIRIWHSESWRQVASWTEHVGFVHEILTIADANRAMSVGNDDTMRLWDISTGECIEKLKISSLVSGAISADGKRVLGGSIGGKIELWDMASAKRVAILNGHSGWVNSIQTTPNGRIAFSGSNDQTVKVWNLESGTSVGTLEGHQGTVSGVAVSPDGSLVASTGLTDQTVRIWDWRLGACLQVVANEESSPCSVAFSPDGSRLVVGTSDGAIFVYLLNGVDSAFSVAATRRYVNAKVVLLGEGTVGKTSLAHRLIEDRYVICDRTHGMNVWRLDLPLPRDVSMEREALLWDLAGQEDYRLIHQLFLDETALALLLINPQKNDPFAEAGDWLKALETVAGDHESRRDAVRLLIFSQVDVGGMKLGNAKIERFCAQHGFAGWLATSAKTGENSSEKKNGGKPSALRRLIAESIPWDRLPWTSTPRLLAELKNAVMAMRDESDIRLLRFAELAQRLDQALPEDSFDESDVRTAVTLLHNHGLVRPLKFGDLVLLQPELLNGYAGAIIRAARAHADEIGCVLEADVYEAGFDFTGVERLKHHPDEELLLRALVQTLLDHSLCIAEETSQGRHLVFPSQYRREKDLPRDPDIFVSYTFSGEWQTVWTTLVVRLWYSQEFDDKELWRNAAEFASGKGHALGLKIDNQQGEGMATISLYFDKEVPDELKAIFIEYAHRHLARYGCEVSRDRRYVCQECGKAVKDLDAVRRRLEAEKDFITCQTCDERVPLMDFIERRLTSDPVARKILAMDEAATRELDAQALEQILIGHMMAIAGEANQIFRPLTIFDYGIDGEVEFKDDDGKASGKRIYIQLKSGNSYLRTRKGDGREVFDVKNERHLEYWISQPVDVYLVIRQTDEASGGQVIRWMNVTHYLKTRKNKKSRQIIFGGEKLDMESIWKVRDQFFPPTARVRGA